MLLQIDQEYATWICTGNFKHTNVFINETNSRFTYTIVCKRDNTETNRLKCSVCIYFISKQQTTSAITVDIKTLTKCKHQQHEETFREECRCKKVRDYCDVYLKRLIDCACTEKCPNYSYSENHFKYQV